MHHVSLQSLLIAALVLGSAVGATTILRVPMGGTAGPQNQPPVWSGDLPLILPGPLATSLPVVDPDGDALTITLDSVQAPVGGPAIGFSIAGTQLRTTFPPAAAGLTWRLALTARDVYGAERATILDLTVGSAVVASCEAWYALGFRADGRYPIVTGAGMTDAQCDMTTDGGGWTLAVNIASDLGQDSRTNDLYYTNRI